MSVNVSTTTNVLTVSSILHPKAQGMVVIYHQCIYANESVVMSSICVSSNENQTAVVSIHVNADCYHVAVFGVTADYSIEESPAAVKTTYINRVQNKSKP